MDDPVPLTDQITGLPRTLAGCLWMDNERVAESAFVRNTG
jgi:hypothetical protein